MNHAKIQHLSDRMQAALLCMDIQENESIMKGCKRFKGYAQLQRIIEYLVETDL